MENKRCQVLVDLFLWLDSSLRKYYDWLLRACSFPNHAIRNCGGAAQAFGGSNQSFLTGVCDQDTWLWCVHEGSWYGSIQICIQNIFPGPFYIKVSFIGMFTKKKARGSGYAEILIETTLLITETLVIVISGKAYSKALFNLKAVESHERLLFKVFGDEAESHQCMLLQILSWTAG